MRDEAEVSPTEQPRTSEWPLVVALVAALIPVLAGAVRAVAGDWRAEYDAGYFVARSMDVFTEHSPRVGAWSSQALYADESYNNLGPMFFYLLAPFVRIDLAWGVAVGVAVIDVLAVIAVAWAARRWLGVHGAVAALAVTVLIEWAFGALAMVDPRQQLALLLPAWATLVLTPLVARGDPSAAVPWVLFASLCLQTHFTYIFLIAALVLIGATGYLLRLRHGGRDQLRGLVAALTVALVVWLPTIWDQVAGSGNLGRVLANGGARPGVGLDDGVQILGSSPLSVIGWWPGWLRQFAEPWPLPIVLATVVLVAWTVGLVSVALGRFGDRHRLGASVALVVLAAALLTVARIPRLGAFGNLPQNHFWLWPAAGFLLLVALSVATDRLSAGGRLRPGQAPWATAAVLVLVATIGAATTGMVFPQWDAPEQLVGGFGRRVIDDTATALADLIADGRIESGEAVLVVPTSVGAGLLLADRYNVLAAVRDAGLDVNFVPGADDLNRFGAQRCRDGRERWQLHIERLTAGVERPPDRTVLADVPVGRSAGEELAAARRAMVEALAGGRLDTDGSALVAELVEHARDDPEAAADELLFRFPPLLNSGAVTVPVELAGLVSTWQVFELTGDAQAVVVSLAPAASGETCDG